MHLYSYFLFIANLNQKIMTHDNNARYSRMCSVAKRPSSMQSYFICSTKLLRTIITWLCSHCTFNHYIKEVQIYCTKVDILAFCVWFPQKFGIFTDTAAKQPRHVLPHQRIFPTILRLYNSIMGFNDNSEFFTYS